MEFPCRWTLLCHTAMIFLLYIPASYPWELWWHLFFLCFLPHWCDIAFPQIWFTLHRELICRDNCSCQMPTWKRVTSAASPQHQPEVAQKVLSDQFGRGISLPPPPPAAGVMPGQWSEHIAREVSRGESSHAFVSKAAASEPLPLETTHWQREEGSNPIGIAATLEPVPMGGLWTRPCVRSGSHSVCFPGGWMGLKRQRQVQGRGWWV